MPDGLCRNVPSSIDIANKQLMPEHDAELCKTTHHKNEMSGRMGYRGLDCGWQCGSGFGVTSCDVSLQGQWIRTALTMQPISVHQLSTINLWSSSTDHVNETDRSSQQDEHMFTL